MSEVQLSFLAAKSTRQRRWLCLWPRKERPTNDHERFRSSQDDGGLHCQKVSDGLARSRVFARPVQTTLALQVQTKITTQALIHKSLGPRVQRVLGLVVAMISIITPVLPEIIRKSEQLRWFPKIVIAP